MGNCCKKGLIHKFDNNTQIYSFCSQSQKAKSQRFRIALEGDMYLLCPDKEPTSNKMIDTDEIYGLKDGLLTFLKDSTGIKTGQHCIKTVFFDILEQASKKEPKANQQNKSKLFKNLVTSIYIFDKRKPRQKYKVKIIILPWKGLSQSVMDELLQESIFSMTILVD